MYLKIRENFMICKGIEKKLFKLLNFKPETIDDRVKLENIGIEQPTEEDT